MRYSQQPLRMIYHLFMGCFIMGHVAGRTIDEIIAGSSNAVTDFDFMGDISGDILRVELDMMMTLQQYKALSSNPSTSTGDSSFLLRKKRKAIASLTQRWTNKQIPYVMERSVFSDDDTNEIRKAINEWQNYTCIRFRPAGSADVNYINFEDGSGCSSYVGMNRGKHPISLANGCRQKGVIVHEIGHAVGFYHEQNRPDRDDHIIIQYNNIVHPNLNHNFQKYPESYVSNYNVPYDYRSIMHYGGRAFSKDGQYTIKTRDPAFQEVIGNRDGLSFNDIKLANIMYKCSEKCNPNIVCPGDGFVDQNCQCVCPGNPIQRCDSMTRAFTQPPTVRTTKPITIQPTTMACKDMNENCGGWAGAGYCLVNNYVKTYCKESCSLCPAECKDLRDNCPQWKQQGYCTDSVYAVFVTEKCPKSCNSGVCALKHITDNSKDSENNGHKAISSVLLVVLILIPCLSELL